MVLSTIFKLYVVEKVYEGVGCSRGTWWSRGAEKTQLSTTFDEISWETRRILRGVRDTQ